ncbi:MAG: membrane protein insertion efficiency factor YidD [Idiomarina sp.]|nr:membrane protein insertion efficiency factor YidD [Idiomarina sp.]
MVATAILKAINLYQRTGGSGRWFGIRCNFTPTCSEYTRQAIAHCGVRRGLSLGWQRIRGCQHNDSFCICHDPFHPPNPPTGSMPRPSKADHNAD